MVFNKIDSVIPTSLSKSKQNVKEDEIKNLLQNQNKESFNSPNDTNKLKIENKNLDSKVKIDIENVEEKPTSLKNNKANTNSKKAFNANATLSQEDPSKINEEDITKKSERSSISRENVKINQNSKKKDFSYEKNPENSNKEATNIIDIEPQKPEKLENMGTNYKDIIEIIQPNIKANEVNLHKDSKKEILKSKETPESSKNNLKNEDNLIKDNHNLHYEEKNIYSDKKDKIQLKSPKKESSNESITVTVESQKNTKGNIQKFQKDQDEDKQKENIQKEEIRKNSEEDAGKEYNNIENYILNYYSKIKN